MKRGIGAVILAGVLFGSAAAQSFNIDLDIFGGPDYIGNGAPSDAFGAAANQPGRWNRIGLSNPGPVQLLGLDGLPTGVTYSYDSVTVSGGVGFNNPANTGDFALLLNDAAQVASVGGGGHVAYNFAGLAPGTYQVYTYAVLPSGATLPVPVTVSRAIDNQTQIVTGPMPGNSFSHLVTHSVHRVEIASGEVIEIDIHQPVGLPSGTCVNGFQIALVPELSSLITMMIGLALFSVRTARCCKMIRQSPHTKGRRFTMNRPQMTLALFALSAS